MSLSISIERLYIEKKVESEKRLNGQLLNKSSTAKLLKQGYLYHKLIEIFSSSTADTMYWFQSFKFQCTIKIYFTSRPTGTTILW